MKIRILIMFCCTLCLLSCQSSQKLNKNLSTSPPKSPSVAVQLADQQLKAYNQRDLDAFLFPFSDSVKVYNMHELDYQGKDRMREAYATWFNGLDSLHCEVINRISEGNTIIDHERVYYKHKNGKSNTFHAVAIYTVEAGKIQEVTFPKVKWKY